MKKLLTTISILLIATASYAQTYTVERVIDGDTIVITTPEGKSETVLFIGIDAPESNVYKQRAISNETGQDLETLVKMGQEATEFVKKYFEKGNKVHLEFDTQKKDKYGRLLAYVYVPERQIAFEILLGRSDLYKVNGKTISAQFLNQEIIRWGYATPMTIPPNVKHADLFKIRYEEAREQKRGLWKADVKGEIIQEQEEGPIARVKTWVKAVREDNIEGFMKHFTKNAQNAPEYVGGKEALLFWKDEIAGDDFSLDSEGFKGEWIKKEGEYKGRQIIFVHPVMPDGPSSEAVWVVKEEGEWRIETLFNRPPKN